jgi:hypothetical protein
MVTKTEALPLKLESFYCGDVLDYMENVPDDEGAICFPPFFAGDYEKMFDALDQLFDWDKPIYEFINEERKNRLFELIKAKKHWIIGLNYIEEGFEDYLVGMTKTTNRGTPIYIFSDTAKRRVVVPRQSIETVKIPRLNVGEDIGEKVSLVKLTTSQFQSLRSQYMNIDIVPGSPLLSFGVLVDGKLIGVFALSKPNNVMHMPNKFMKPYIYLLSDFPVAPTGYKHLAKLVLYIARSKEVKLIAEQALSSRVNSLVTTAFSHKAVSMKYRNIFELVGRLEGKNGEKNKLNYASTLGLWSMQEGLEKWKKECGGKR